MTDNDSARAGTDRECARRLEHHYESRSTGLAIAAQRAAETAQPDPLMRDEFAAILIAAVNEPGWNAMARGDLSWMGHEDDFGRRLISATSHPQVPCNCGPARTRDG